MYCHFMELRVPLIFAGWSLALIALTWNWDGAWNKQEVRNKNPPPFLPTVIPESPSPTGVIVWKLLEVST